MPRYRLGSLDDPPQPYELRAARPDLTVQAVDPETGLLRLGSNKRVQWRCDNGHTWTASVDERVRGRGPCRTCRSIGFTMPDLAVQLVNPQHAAYWPNSKHEVEWRCENGHTWPATVLNRATKDSGCPYCTGRLPVSGETDLATLRPDLAAQVVDADPTMLTLKTTKRVMWRCENGHTYLTSVYNRTSRGSECDYCAGRKATPGVNDLATLRPNLAAEAVDTDPSTLTLGSAKKVRWRCAGCGYQWSTSVANRTRSSGTGCPACARSGYNPGKPGHLYLLGRQKDGNEQRKIGITNDPSVRLATLARYGWSPIEVSPPIDGRVVLDAETRFLRKLRGAGIVAALRNGNFEPGVTEMWKYEQYPLDTLTQVLDLANTGS